MIVNELIYVAFVPLAVAAAAAFILRRMRSPPPVCWSTGVGLGYVVGQLVLSGRSGAAWAIQSLVSPREAGHWVPHAVLLALGMTILATYAPRRWRQGVVGLAALLTFGVPARLLAGHLAQQWSALEKISHLALLAATLALVWLLLAAARDDEFPRLRQTLLVLAS